MGGKASLLLVMGFSFILAYISFNMNRYATSAVSNMSLYNETTASHNLAVTGANVMLSQFYQDSTMRGTFTESFDTTHGGNLIGSFTATIEDVPYDKIRLRSVSSYPRGAFSSLHDTVEVFFDRHHHSSFTLFAWMTNFEGNDDFWVSGDTVFGRVHSNGRIHVNGDPVFWGKVTLTKGMDPPAGKGVNQSILKQGLETGVATINFPTDLSELVSASDPMNGGRHYTGSKWLTLYPGSSANGDGYVLVRDTETGPVTDSVSFNDPSFTQGVIMADGDVHVQGTLDGALTISSMTNVLVQGDVLYERDPFTMSPSDPPSDDVLGLVANNSVIVPDVPSLSGNLHIDGSIFARTGSFNVENYNSRGVEGQLTVHGSIAQYTRGKIGQYAGNTLTDGYSKNFRFDQRLADPSFKPPHYPGYDTKTLAISNWWESYRIIQPED